MTGDYYVISGTVNWADEMDVCFFEVLDKDQAKKYKIAQDIFGSLYACYYFGTNEGWDDCDFDLLDFELIPATDEEVEVLYKFNVSGHRLFISTMTHIGSERDYYNLEDINMITASTEVFEAACRELKAKYDEEDKDYDEVDRNCDL